MVVFIEKPWQQFMRASGLAVLTVKERGGDVVFVNRGDPSIRLEKLD